MRGSVRAVALLAVSVGGGVLVLSSCARVADDRWVHPIYTGPVPTVSRTPPSAADEVAAGMRRAGAPIKVTMPFTARRDPDRLLGKPGGYVAKTAFMDLELDAAKVRGHGVFDLERGGWVEVFRSAPAARERAVRLQAEAPDSEYGILSGKALVRLSRYVPRAAVRAYERYVHKATGDPVRRVRP